MGVSHVYPNRNVLKDCQARGARAPGAPLVPPPMTKLKMEKEIKELGLRNRRGRVRAEIQRKRMGEDFAPCKASKKRKV